MDSAKEIARDMLDAINIDSSGFLGAVEKGFISFPVSLGYLGYDFINTTDRRENRDDKFRIAELLKRITFSREVIQMVIKPFFNEFTSRIDSKKIENLSKRIAGNFSGKLLFSHVTGFNLGRAIVSQGWASFMAGGGAGGLLIIGAESSRSIYTSSSLRDRNPSMYTKLRQLGDYDLLYYLVEDIVRPYEKACEIADANPAEFDKICDYFLGGL